MVKQVLQKIAMGASGLVGTEIMAEAIPTDTADIPNIVNIIVQIVIGIATLFGLFKKSK